MLTVLRMIIAEQRPGPLTNRIVVVLLLMLMLMLIISAPHRLSRNSRCSTPRKPPRGAHRQHMNRTMMNANSSNDEQQDQQRRPDHRKVEVATASPARTLGCRLSSNGRNSAYRNARSLPETALKLEKTPPKAPD